MARVTIDDCTDKIESRFDLVLFSAHRARQLLEGVTLSTDAPKIDRTEKKTVHALREIAQVDVTPDELRESMIKRLQNEHVLDSEQNTSLNELIQKNTKEEEKEKKEKEKKENNTPFLKDNFSSLKEPSPPKETLLSPLMNFSDESLKDPEET